MSALGQFLPDTPVSRRRRYEQLAHRLVSERQASVDSDFRELTQFLTPRRARFTVSERNRTRDTRRRDIINSTANFSLRTLASGMHAGLTSPARPWMKLTTPDPELAKFGPVKEWLHEVTIRMLSVFEQTNLYQALPQLYTDLGGYGTGAIAILEDSRELFRCEHYPIGSYALGLDARGAVTSFVHEYEATVRQVVEQFGVRTGYRDIDWSRISATVRSLWDKGDYEEPVPVTWVITPNDHADPQRIESRYLPWASVHFETGDGPAGRQDGRMLRESGFRTFPIMAPRWDVTGRDTYGTDCPGMMALGDVKQLQIEERRKGQAIHKGVDPPLVGPGVLRGHKTSLLPGDTTYVDVREGMQGLKPIHEVNLNLQHMAQDIAQVQYRIQRAFFEDLFLMLAQSDQLGGAERPTAREVQERHEEKLLALGPVLERTKTELHDPTIERTYDLMERENMIPEPPDELDGVRIKVTYTSIMAEAQKMVGIVGLDRFVASTIPLSEVTPEVVDKVDWMMVIDNYGDMLGIDPRIIRSTEEARQLAQQRAQQQQIVAAAETAKTLAQAGQAAGQTPLQGDTMLRRAMGA